jgi:uncharacterized LabA/DUF88 family protein
VKKYFTASVGCSILVLTTPGPYGSDGVAYMTTPLPQPPSRAILYVDGFNLYYGTLAQSPYRWLDLDLLAQRLRPLDQIEKVRYFTAMVSGPTRTNQETYLRALATTPRVEVVLGSFKKKTVECINQNCPGPHRKRRFFQTQEEKRTDVNIALHMLDDAYRGICDRIVLISGDSDLVPAIEMVISRFPAIKVNVYIPVPVLNPPQGARERSYKKELRNVSTTVRELPSQLLPHSLFPDPLVMPDGTSAKMPLAWRAPKGPKQFSCATMAVGPCGWCGKQ